MSAPAPARQTSATKPPFKAAVRAGTPAVFCGCLAYAGGTLLAREVFNPAVEWLAASLVTLCAASYFFCKRQERLTLALALLMLGLVAALTLELQAASGTSLENDPEFVRLTNGDELQIVAHVTHEGGTITEFFGRPHQSFDVETESVGADAAPHSMKFGMRVGIYSPATEQADAPASQSTPLPDLRYGDRIQLAAKLRHPRNFRNPGEFDYEGFLREQNILALASARADRIARLPGFGGTRLSAWRSRIQRSLQGKIHNLWPGQDGAFMSAMLLGDRTGVDREATIDYQRTGAYHILVVAGLKVGILAFALLWLFRLLSVPAWMATCLTIVTAFAYAFITNSGAPVARATLMLAVYLAGRLVYRERNHLNAIGIAGFAMLALDPRALFDPSFQLTFLSIVAIAGIALPIMERTSAPYLTAMRNFDSRDFDLSLEPKLVQFRLDLRLIAQRLSRFFGAVVARWLMIAGWRLALGAFDVLLLSAVLQVSLALPMATCFHRAVTLGLPANAVVVPLHAALLPLAALAIGLSYVWLPAAHWFAASNAIFLQATNWTVECLAHWRLAGFTPADMRVATPSVAVSVCCGVAFALAVLLVRQRRLFAVAGLVGLTLCALWVCHPPRPQTRPGTVEVTAIDVGQGDSILLVAPTGKTLLIDAGGEAGAAGNTHFDMGEDVVSPYLWSRGITQLDAIALTHAHADHIGGMASVINNFHPKELWVGPLPSTLPVRLMRHAAEEQNCAVMRRVTGDEFDFGGAHLRVLAPPVDWPVESFRAENNDSLVMKVTYGSTSALLEGDAERAVEHELASEDPSAGLLKVGHHGSATSTIPDILAAVHPQWGVISVGFRNSFHHPRRDVLARLQAAGVRTYRTDTAGAISFYLDGKTITARPQLGR